MKKQIVFLAATLFSISAFAQKETIEEKSGFKKENVFLGGTLALGYGSASGVYGGSSFVIGANPEIGYSFAEWIDAGLAFNAIFNTTKYTDGPYNIKQNSFNYGAGVFTRIYPFNGFFIQLQPEYNWISYKSTVQNQPTIPVQKNTVKATSFLAGLGYGQRIIGQMNFFTVIMVDLGSEQFSPYRDGYGNMVPVIRGGINFYLHPSRKK